MAQNNVDSDYGVCTTPLGVQETNESIDSIDVGDNIIDNNDDDSVIIVLEIPGNAPGTGTSNSQPPPPPRRLYIPIIRIPRLCEEELANATMVDDDDDDDDDETDTEYDSNSSGEEYIPNEEEEILSGDE